MSSTLVVPPQRRAHPQLACACCPAPATRLVKTTRACDGRCVRAQLACAEHAPALLREHSPGEVGQIVTTRTEA